jgi:hypothetical protein
MGDLTDLPSPLAVEGFSNCRRFIRPNSFVATLPAERSALSGMPTSVGWGRTSQGPTCSSSSSSFAFQASLIRLGTKPPAKPPELLVLRMPSSRAALALREPVPAELHGGCASGPQPARAFIKNDWATDRRRRLDSERLGMVDGAVRHVRHRDMPTVAVNDSVSGER